MEISGAYLGWVPNYTGQAASDASASDRPTHGQLLAPRPLLRTVGHDVVQAKSSRRVR